MRARSRGCALRLRAVMLHNRLAQPHLLMRSALHNVPPEVAERFLCGIRSFLVMHVFFVDLFKRSTHSASPALDYQLISLSDSLANQLINLRA